MATPIQFWKLYETNIPSTSVGDNIYFGLSTDKVGSVWVTNNQGENIKVGQNYDNEINALNSNGCNGKYAPIPEFTDYNSLTDTGIFHGVYYNSKLNEPVQDVGHRRLTIMNFKTTDRVYFQQLIYNDGAGAGKIYERFNNGEWIQLVTADMLETLKTRITDIENALGGIN